MKTTNITFLIFLWGLAASAQTIEPANLISNADFYLLGATGLSLHSSLGELATENLSDENRSISQGFLQVYLDLVPTEELEDADLLVSVGPNPCRAAFTIKMESDLELTASLFDLHGRKVRETILTAPVTPVSVENLPAGTYFLTIHHKHRTVFKTTKLIKL